MMVIITGLAKEEHNNREYCILSSKLIIKALNRTELSFQEVNKFSLHFEQRKEYLNIVRIGPELIVSYDDDW